MYKIYSSTIPYCTKLLYHSHSCFRLMEVTSRAPRRFVGALQGRAAVTVMRTSLRTPGGPSNISNMAGREIPSQWGIEWKQTTIIDVPLACLTRGYFGLMFGVKVAVSQDCPSFTPKRSIESWCCLGCYLGSGRAHSWSRSGAEVCSLLRWKTMVWLWFTI